MAGKTNGSLQHIEQSLPNQPVRITLQSLPAARHRGGAPGPAEGDLRHARGAVGRGLGRRL